MTLPVPDAPALACPCRLAEQAQRSYTACCGRWHSGPLHLQAPDAEALMRSRYSAFVLELADYLLTTWHPTTRPTTLQFDAGARWLGVQIKRHQPQDADHALVEFVARSKLNGRAHRLHEISSFVRATVEGSMRWYYVDGNVSAPA